MSEKRFGYGETDLFELLNKQQVTITKLKKLNNDKGKSIISLIRKNEQLKKEAKRTEEEKEHFADLYNECRRFKLSDEYIKQAYADLNRREREKHSQGNAKYIAKINQNEVIY